MSKYKASIGLICLLLSLARCQPAAPQQSMTFEISQPALWQGACYPSLTVGGNGVLYMSYLQKGESGTDSLFVSELDPHGQPLARFRVAYGTDWFVNWADFPTVAATRNGLLAASWLQKSAPGTYDYNVMVSLSPNEGATWQPPFKLHADTVAAEHGFVSMAPDGAGNIRTVWLDGRYTKPAGAMAAHAHAGHGSGAMTLRSALIHADGSVSDRQEIDPRVCDCCGTDLRMSQYGAVVAYRDRIVPEVRDISLALLKDSTWLASEVVGDDGWNIAGCPVNGPAIDVQDRYAAVAWFTRAQDTSKVQVLRKDLITGEASPPLQIDEGNPLGRVQIAWLEDQKAVAAWVEVLDNQEAALKVAHIDFTNREVCTMNISRYEAGRRSGFPSMRVVNGEALLVWTDWLQDENNCRLSMARIRFPE